jgi:MFS family permease
MAVLLQQLPWLLFGLLAGALSDRLDRRLVVVAVDAARAVVLALLAARIATGAVSFSLVLGRSSCSGRQRSSRTTRPARCFPCSSPDATSPWRTRG